MSEQIRANRKRRGKPKFRDVRDYIKSINKKPGLKDIITPAHVVFKNGKDRTMAHSVLLLHYEA